MIEPATPIMARELASLHEKTFGREGWSSGQIEGSLRQETTKSFIQRDGGNITAFILCKEIEGEVEILTLSVAPEYQRQNIGTELMNHVLALAGGRKIFLEVAVDNLPAIGLYEKTGFVLFGRRKNYYKRGEILVDALLYCYKK